MKKALSILLTAVLLVSLFTILPFSANAETRISGDEEWEYEVLEDGTAKTTNFRGTYTDTLTVPPYIDGYTVTVVGNNTFYRWMNYFECETVIVPNTVTEIQGDAFRSISIKRFTIPNSVKTLTSVLSGQPIEEIIIPNNVTQYGEDTFRSCAKLKSVKLSTGCNAIPWRMFDGCTALETIIIPGNVTGIGSFAFWGCTALRSVKFSKLQNGLEIGNGSFTNCSSLKTIDLPDGLTDIGFNAFVGCTKLGSIEFPDSLTFCDYSAFEGCTALKSVRLSASMDRVRTACFKDCTALTSVTFPASIDIVDTDAFNGCTALASATWQGDTSWGISDRAFMGCTSLAKVTLPAKEMFYIADAFVNCPKLISVKTPATVTSEIYDYAFGYNYNSTTDAYTKQPNFTVYGYTGSAGEAYANDNGFKFFPIDPVAAPEISKLENTVSGVQLTIKKVAGAVKYRVFLKNDGKWKTLGDTTATSYLHKGVQSGTKYTYTVRCVTEDGVEYVSDYNKTGKSIQFIAAPTITKLTNTLSGVQLTFTKSAGAAKFRVFVKNSGKWTKLGDTTANTFVHKAAKSGVKYTYTVRCISKDAQSFTSGYDTVGKSATFIAAPALPTLKNTKNGVQVTIKKVNGAAKYRIFRRTAGKSWAKVADTAKLTYVDKTAKNGMTYIYTVRCLSADGKAYNSAYNTAGRAIKCVR